MPPIPVNQPRLLPSVRKTGLAETGAREKVVSPFSQKKRNTLPESSLNNAASLGVGKAPSDRVEKKLTPEEDKVKPKYSIREQQSRHFLDKDGNYDIIKAKEAGIVNDDTINRIENYGNDVSIAGGVGNINVGGGGAILRASRIPADLTKRGFIDLRGQKVENHRDLAAISQIFIAPRNVETTAII